MAPLIMLGYIISFESLPFNTNSFKNTSIEISTGVKGQVDYISIRQKIDEMLCNKQDVYSVVKFVDDILVEKTGFSRKEMDTIYNEWQKICKKRNNKR